MAQEINPSGTMNVARRALLRGTALTALALLLGPVPALAGIDPSDATWEAIKSDHFTNLNFEDGSGKISFEAPARAEDAATVPMDIRVADTLDIARLSLIIDENPVPLAAIFTFGPASGGASLQTRVRVNAYSYVRVIAEARDGTQYMVKRFIKATGGCAAPAGKDPVAAEAGKGEMRFRRFDAASPREAQMMIRHPNHTGFQMDQVTLLFVPPNFVETITIAQGDDLILRVDGGISISEDPNIRFFYKEDRSKTITVSAVDTQGRQYQKSWSPTDA
ncbi:MAG: quinoprotein dehydrogenase-associated SoxYZ-like carrier [Rhizobiales bacterium]|nr:quinoprotein dehydrogenase-associated SoxYZ-like carrier [Hyphomicrobiales bacterium]